MELPSPSENPDEMVAWSRLPDGKYRLEPGLKFSFTLTYTLLLTTGTITLIEALRTEKPVFRHVMNLETAISIIAGYFYSQFVDRIQKAEDGLAQPMPWSEMTRLRYVDWCITTPIMLTVIMLVMTNGLKKPLHFRLWISVIALNYAMMAIGYAGETGRLNRGLADVLGFVPFVAVFTLLYCNYIRPRYVFSNYLIFGLYLVVWSMYGVVYMLDDVWKNTIFNFLDLVSKCFVGVGLWALFTRIIDA